MAAIAGSLQLVTAPASSSSSADLGGVILKGCFGERRTERACGDEGPEVEIEGSLPRRRGDVELMRFSVGPRGETGGLNDRERG